MSRQKGRSSMRAWSCRAPAGRNPVASTGSSPGLLSKSRQGMSKVAAFRRIESGAALERSEAQGEPQEKAGSGVRAPHTAGPSHDVSLGRWALAGTLAVSPLSGPVPALSFGPGSWHTMTRTPSPCWFSFMPSSIGWDAT